MTGVAELIANQGIATRDSNKPPFMAAGSPRRRGVMQGTFIFLISFLVVPIVMAISIMLNHGPFATFITSVLLGVGGLLRIAYALMFEAGTPGGMTVEENLLAASQQAFLRKPDSGQLPAASSIPASAYTAPGQGAWRDTNDLAGVPGSVTDSTTKLLEKNS